MIKKSLLSAFSCLAFLMSATANAVILDFEGFLAGTVITNQNAGVTISATNFQNGGLGNDLAVVFDTDNPTGNDPDLGAPFDSNNPALADDFMPGKVLIIQENNVPASDPNDEGSRPAGFFTFEFDKRVTLHSIDFFDVEGAETVQNAIRLFDANGVEILPGSFFTPDTGGNNLWDQVVFGVDEVKSIQLNMGGSGAIDNINYTVIPLPAAVWLFGSGIAGLICASKRKKI